MAIMVKILREGDEVLNVLPNSSGYCISIRRNKEVYVYSVTLDENNLPRIDKNNSLIITFGDDEVQASIPISAERLDGESQEAQGLSTNDEVIKATTF